MDSTATSVLRSCWIRGLVLLWLIAISFLYPSRLCHAQITTFEFAYDRLLAEVFYNEPADTQIFGNPEKIDGSVNIKTSRGEIMVGKGPGWVFYFADDSRQITLHNVVLVSTSGKVTRKELKEKPLEIGDYVTMDTMDRPRMAEMRAEVALTSEKEAYDWLIHKLLGHAVGDRRIYVYPDKFENEIIVKTPQKTIDMGSGPGWLFFIDDVPLANWAHACRFVLVAASGRIKVQTALWPPDNFSLFSELTTAVPEPPYRTGQPRSDHTIRNENLRRFALRATPAANRWAVIFSGGGRPGINHTRYWNDCAFFYETLIDHGFLDDHIFVIISDGTDPANDRVNGTSSPLDLDGDGDNDIGFSATAANIGTVFNDLANNLDGDDILYIFTTNHGNTRDACRYDDPDVNLTLYHNPAPPIPASPAITDIAFAQQINRVTTRATVCIFEQCFSGGMLDELYAPNRVLMSAARFWQSSFSGGGDAAGYDEFSYYVTHALANPDDADANGDRIVSMEEAYLYAQARDAHQSEDIHWVGAPTNCWGNEGEHPCYYSNPWDLGRKISLNGIQEHIPYNPLMAKYTPTTGYTQAEVMEAFPTGGTARGWKADDNFWLCNLPFNFPYGGQIYSGVWVGSNGIVYLNNPGSGNHNENSVSGLIGRNAIAPLWDDLMTVQTGDDIFTSSSGKWFTIRWRAHTVRDATPRPVNVALKISSDGAIRFLYGSGNDHTSIIDQRDKTIGISMGNGLYHLSLRNGAWDLGNANTIEYLPYTAIYVDGVHSGAELGTKELPYNTVSEGYNAITKYGALIIKGGSYAGNQNVPITLRKPIRITNYQGPAIIGSP